MSNEDKVKMYERSISSGTHRVLKSLVEQEGLKVEKEKPTKKDLVKVLIEKYQASL